MASSTPEAVIERLDGGGYKDKGHYRCLVDGCRWEKAEAYGSAPDYHVKSHHLGMKLVQHRLEPSCRQKRRLTPEEKKEKNRLRKVEWRKVRPQTDHACGSLSVIALTPSLYSGVGVCSEDDRRDEGEGASAGIRISQC